MMIRVNQNENCVVFAVRVTPNARRESMDGEWQGALRVRIAAPPADDRANDALVELLARRLKLPRTAVRIIAGARSRLKRIEARGATPGQIRALGEASDGE